MVPFGTMSGIEGIAALGLVSSITQLISFAHESYNVGKAILESGSPDPRLSDASKSLCTISSDVEASLNALQQPLNKDQRELRALSAECLRVATELDTELGAIAKDAASGKLRRAIVGNFKALTKRKKIDKLELAMTKAQQDLATRFLIRIAWVLKACTHNYVRSRA